jgi:hypothetical protein
MLFGVFVVVGLAFVFSSLLTDFKQRAAADAFRRKLEDGDPRPRWIGTDDYVRDGEPCACCGSRSTRETSPGGSLTCYACEPHHG